jgi:DNA-binding NtrC family response regulator
LAHEFLYLAASEEHRHIHGFEAGVLNALKQKTWASNVRELRQNVHRAVVLCQGTQLSLGDFTISLPEAEISHAFTLFEGEHIRPFESLEKAIYTQAFTHYEGRMGEMAMRLGVGRTTLYRKLSAFGVKVA